MGKKLKYVSDPFLAKPHAPGSTMALTQPVLHKQFGEVNYFTPDLWVYHFSRAHEAFEALESLQGDLLAVPVAVGNVRIVGDSEMLDSFYKEGFDCVVHTYLAFDHFLFGIMRQAYWGDVGMRRPTNKWEVMAKLRHILKKILEREDLINSPGYTKLAEVEVKRHAFNHPTTRRWYNGDVNTWDEVPLAWVIAGGYQDAYIKSRDFFEEIYELWEKKKVDYEHPENLLNVQRGIRSKHQVKKPPKS